MKKIFLLLVVGFALLVANDSSRSHAGDEGGIPLSELAGNYSAVTQGSITICFKPDFSATEACSTAGAVAVPCNVVDVGQSVSDENGNSCVTTTDICSFAGTRPPPQRP